MQKESLIGQTFAAKYQVTGFLGEGGMARVYLATDASTNQQVALKVLHKHLTSEREVVKRFDREMKLASVVKHDNSVAVLEYGDFEGRLFLVMELVDGDSLGEVLLDDAPLTPDRTVHIARQIAAALGAAHARGIVHRDLKPDNVMIDQPGDNDIVKVCDFGLARSITGSLDESGDELDDDDEGSSFQTAIGVRVGTPHYMSPEYITTFDTDERGDLYALGVLMFEMLTGKPPYDGRPYEVMDSHVTGTVPHPSKKNAACPAWLDGVVVKLLAKEPDARFQTADDLLAALRGAGDAADQADAVTEEAALAGVQVHVPGEDTAAGGNRGLVLAGAGAVGVVGIGALGVLLLLVGIGLGVALM